MALRAMDNPDELKELWLPQFKCNQSVTTDALCGLTPATKAYNQESELELYTLPKSDGTPEVEPSQGSLVLTEEFVVAVTHAKVTELLEMPLAVIPVSQNSWKRIQ